MNTYGSSPLIGKVVTGFDRTFAFCDRKDRKYVASATLTNTTI